MPRRSTSGTVNPWGWPVADFRCDLCWVTFDSPVELLLHEAAEDDRIYTVDGLDDQPPSKYVETM